MRKINPSKYKTKKTIRKNNKHYVRVEKKFHEDLLLRLKTKLEDKHIKDYTFIVKGSRRYTQGIFWSEKNQKKYVFRSTYEYGFYYSLENDISVLSYVVEPFEVPYIDRAGNNRVYIPDVIVMYNDNVVKLFEIKPKRRLKDKEVRMKAAAARRYLKEFMPHVTYTFITEEDIFNKPSDYDKLLKKLDPQRAAKRADSKTKRVKKEVNKKLQTEKRKVPYILL